MLEPFLIDICNSISLAFAITMPVFDISGPPRHERIFAGKAGRAHTRRSPKPGKVPVRLIATRPLRHRSLPKRSVLRRPKMSKGLLPRLPAQPAEVLVRRPRLRNDLEVPEFVCAGAPPLLGLAFPICFGRHHGAAPDKAGQSIADVKPRKLILRPHVISDANALRQVQAANGDLNTVCQHFLVHAECAPAGRAEATLRERRGPVARRPAANPSEVLRAEVNEWQHRGT